MKFRKTTLTALLVAMLLPAAVATAKTPSVHDDQKEKQWTSMENGPWDFCPGLVLLFPAQELLRR